MARPVTLFTGQWADLPLAELAEKAAGWGFDGLELACWGDHFDVGQALADPGYTDTRREILDRHGLQCFAISTHLVSQCVCDPIDERHRAILSPELWGDGEPEGVRQRAAVEVANTARAAAKLGVTQVNGFTGSSVWHQLYSFPPNDWDAVERGYTDFAERWSPIIDVFDQEGVRFGLEVHPTEIAFDIASAERAIEAVGGHESFGFNFDPSHLGYQGVDYVAFIRRFANRIFHVHMKDVWWGHGDGSTGVFGGHTSFGDPRRFWDFRSVGRGDIHFEDVIVALNDIGYDGPLSVEWEDGRMDRVHGATESAAFVRGLDFPASAVAFDAAYDKEAR